MGSGILNAEERGQIKAIKPLHFLMKKCIGILIALQKTSDHAQNEILI